MTVDPWKRALFRSLDAVYTAPLRERRGGMALACEVLRRGSNFDRIAAVERLASAHLPGVMARLRAALHDPSLLPILAEGVRPFAFGQGSSCIITEGDPPRVIKIFRESLGQSVPQLRRFAGALRDDYDTLKRWYAAIPTALPRTVHVVLHAPLRGAGAAARIQDLVTGSTALDLFDTRHEPRILEAMRCSPELAAEVRSFVRATRRAWDAEGRSLDVAGPKNVLVVGRPGGPRLQVVDFGIWDLSVLRRRAPRVVAGADESLSRLERVTDA